MSQQAPELRLPSHGDYQLNAVSHTTFGLGKRGGTDHIRRLPIAANPDAFTAWLSRDSSERYQAVYDGTQLRVFSLTGEEHLVIIEDNALSYLQCDKPRRDLASLTLADTTLILNRRRPVKMTTDETADLGTPTAIVYVRSGNYKQNYGVRLRDAGGTSWTFNPSVTTSETDPAEVATSFIANALASQIESDTSSAYDATIETGASTFTLVKADGSDFDIESFDSVGGNSVVTIKNQVSHYSQLPTNAPNGYTVKVLGNTDDSADDYWVKFEEDRSSTGGARRGKWVETVAPETPYRLDRSTMPHRLDRLQDDAAGTVTGIAYKIYFKLSQVAWSDRVVGDTTTSKTPSIVGGAITCMFLSQNRLGFASKNAMIMSRPGSYANFWRQTVTQSLDNDPIDVRLNPGRLKDDAVLNINHALSFANELILFGENAQVTLTFDGVPNAANLRQRLSSTYESDRWTPPISSQNSAFLPFRDGQYTRIREYFVNAMNAQREADEITRNVGRLLSGRPVHMTVCGSESTLFVQADGDRSKLGVFRWTDNGPERVQASWGLWDVGGDVLSFEVIGTTLWLVVNRPEGPTLESMELEANANTTDTAYPLLLDRKVAVGPAVIRPASSSPNPDEMDTPVDPTSPTSGGGGSGTGSLDDEDDKTLKTVGEDDVIPL